MIYFIECAGRVKIGKTTNVDTRFSSIATAAPFDCQLLGVMDGGYREEAKLHKQWASDRVVREWFTLTDELRSWIKANTRHYDLQTVQRTDVWRLFNEIGRERVCERMRVGTTALSRYSVEGLFPPSWYKGMQELGEEKGVNIPDTLFNWREPSASEARATE